MFELEKCMRQEEHKGIHKRLKRNVRMCEIIKWCQVKGTNCLIYRYQVGFSLSILATMFVAGLISGRSSSSVQLG